MCTFTHIPNYTRNPIKVKIHSMYFTPDACLTGRRIGGVWVWGVGCGCEVWV